MSDQPAADPRAEDTIVDLLVVGSGTGMAAALAAAERGLDVLVVEKTAYVGGSTARSGGAFWVPDNPVLEREGAQRDPQGAATYLDALVGDDAAPERRRTYLQEGPSAVAMLERTTPLRFFWAKGYADYHPEEPGGSAVGRTCEARPFDLRSLGEDRSRFRPAPLEAPIPMPVTGADYKWFNLMTRVPTKAAPRIARRLVEGLGGLAVGREYAAGGQALAAGMLAGLRRAGVPVWTRTEVVELLAGPEADGSADGAAGADGGSASRVTGALVEQDGRQVRVTARAGVVLATGGFDHAVAWRREHISETLTDDHSLGSEGNLGDGIELGRALGADTALMDQAWWFPAGAPLPGGEPQILLAERSLPGSLIVDQTGDRFIDEATDYMTFGQRVLELRASHGRAQEMWLVMDQTYRNSYVLAGVAFPRIPLPAAWLDAGIAVQADDPRGLARAMGVPEDGFEQALSRFNQQAGLGVDSDFGRGNSAYDRYYGDPTVTPNPCLRPLAGRLYALRMVLSDLGTCGGLVADGQGRVLRADGSVVAGLYAIGNTAANVFGRCYPGAGATIGQGLVYGYVIGSRVARRTSSAHTPTTAAAGRQDSASAG
ncbi:3-ketosteroid-delta-1-dehydrogenase [Arsenicicoccus sp. oral taxon 190]|uniref:3-ketosteroid-delta-1-dehydrogenase n=1 Tax=Arsenicicoccus sp. oral taxon 190 TaxID=1658671 RepID=UPI0009E5742B|nr:3-ketosteroid-delta-1-dehydrogenase [Arsenicicoccus sp. oral taxon 190]